MPADSLTWSIDELLDRAQCSKGELMEGLKLIDAIQMANNSWVMIDSDFRMRVVSLICNVISENSWSWKAVPKNEAVQVICLWLLGIYYLCMYSPVHKCWPKT